MEEDALTVIMDHLSRLWEQRKGTAPAETELRALFRALRLQVLGLEPGEQQRVAAETRLTQVLADPARQGDAFDALARMAASMAVGQRWMSRQQVLAWLRDQGFELKAIRVSTSISGRSRPAREARFQPTWVRP